MYQLWWAPPCPHLVLYDCMFVNCCMPMCVISRTNALHRIDVVVPDSFMSFIHADVKVSSSHDESTLSASPLVTLSTKSWKH